MVVLYKTLSRIPVACLVRVPENHRVAPIHFPNTALTYETYPILNRLLTTRQCYTSTEESEINVGVGKCKIGVKLEKELEIKHCTVESNQALCTTEKRAPCLASRLSVSGSRWYVANVTIALGKTDQRDFVIVKAQSSGLDVQKKRFLWEMSRRFCSVPAAEAARRKSRHPSVVVPHEIPLRLPARIPNETFRKARAGTHAFLLDRSMSETRCPKVDVPSAVPRLGDEGKSVREGQYVVSFSRERGKGPLVFQALLLWEQERAASVCSHTPGCRTRPEG